MAERIPAGPAGCVDYRAHRAPGRQDHDCRLGDRASHAIYVGRLSVIGCPRNDKARKRCAGYAKCWSKSAPSSKPTTSTGLNSRTDHGCWRCQVATESIRGLTVDGWIVADEAARLSDDLIAALSPMRARRPEARFAMLSTAWSRTDPVLDGLGRRGSVLDAAEGHGRACDFFLGKFLEQQRRSLGEDNFQARILRYSRGRRGQSVRLGFCSSARP